MRHSIGSIAVLLLITTTSPTLYGQDLNYQPPTSSWTEQLKGAFFPGFQPSEEGMPGVALMAPTQQRNVFEDDFLAAQGDMNANQPVGNIFNFRF